MSSKRYTEEFKIEAVKQVDQSEPNREEPRLDAAEVGWSGDIGAKLFCQ